MVTQKAHFMTSPRVIYFGISTQRSAVEVGGWSKVDQMGLKDALTYDTTNHKYHNYTKSQVTNLINDLQIADLIVGFNQLQFDYQILSTYTDTDLSTLPNFDMLSKIEQTLNFRVSRDNLAYNTLGNSKNSKSLSTLENRVEITKKLFAHGCKEGYLSYHNNRFGTKEVCNTSNWADTARSITQRKQLLDPIVTPDEPELLQSPATQRIPSESPKKKPISEPITTLPTKFPEELPQPLRTPRQVNFAPRLSREEYLRAKYPDIPDLNKNSIGKRIPKEALQIYGAAKSQQHHHPALHTYKKVASLLDSSISFQQFNVAIVGLWRDQNPHKSYQTQNPRRYYYFDRSSTLASERVSDHIDIRNIKEELARGI